jgi:hypothetical protein
MILPTGQRMMRAAPKVAGLEDKILGVVRIFGDQGQTILEKLITCGFSQAVVPLYRAHDAPWIAPHGRIRQLARRVT